MRSTRLPPPFSSSNQWQAVFVSLCIVNIQQKTTTQLSVADSVGNRTREKWRRHIFCYIIIIQSDHSLRRAVKATSFLCRKGLFFIIRPYSAIQYFSLVFSVRPCVWHGTALFRRTAAFKQTANNNISTAVRIRHEYSVPSWRKVTSSRLKREQHGKQVKKKRIHQRLLYNIKKSLLFSMLFVCLPVYPLVFKSSNK